MIADERREELDRAWDECETWTDEEYRDWWEDLTDEERALIESWDKQYGVAFNHLAKTEGRLYYNADQGRYGLMSHGKWVVEGFHCGEGLEVWIDGEWIQTRVEMTADEQWYLVDLPGMVLYDLKARVE